MYTQPSSLAAFRHRALTPCSATHSPALRDCLTHLCRLQAHTRSMLVISMADPAEQSHSVAHRRPRERGSSIPLPIKTCSKVKTMRQSRRQRLAASRGKSRIGWLSAGIAKSRGVRSGGRGKGPMAKAHLPTATRAIKRVLHPPPSSQPSITNLPSLM